MKKGALFILFLLVFQMSFVLAAESVSDKGYACLESKVAEECSSLSTEEKIFSLLAIDRCKTEMMEDSLDEECWPNSGCKIKTTAQAILALNSIGTDTTKIENWILEQKLTPPDVDWLLQVDTETSASCTVYYGDSSYSFSIDEDKKLSKSAGTCLKLYDGDYWFEISSSCYDEEFMVSCDKTFSTSLLYKKINSDVIYISNELNSASAEGTSTEKINSFCFGTSGCDYEGTLWAAMILNYRGYDTSPYLPYLTTIMEENSEYLPEAFLYAITNDFGNELLLKQKENLYWSESGDKFYDTAVALYPLQSESSEQKTNAIAWLEEVQGTDGCWQGNIRNTAFILASVWPTKSVFVDNSKGDCEDNGYYCMTEAACTESGGDVLVDYSGCFGTEGCCTVQKLLKSCATQGGEVCSSNEDCIGGTEVEAADTDSCCIGGACGVSGNVELTECEKSGGICKSSCSGNEKVSTMDCDSYDICCISKKSTGVGLIIFLSVLIIVTALGIIFRKKLRMLWLKIKSKFRRNGKGAPPVSPRPGGFPPPSSSITPRSTSRRILPPRTPVQRRAPVQKHAEIDEVLKKLKEIGK